MMKFMIRLLAFLCAVLMVISLGIATVGYAFATSTDIANEVEENFIEEPPEVITLEMTEEIDIPEEDPNESELIDEAVLATYQTDRMIETFGYDFEYVCRVVTAEANRDQELCYWCVQSIFNGCVKENAKYNPEELLHEYRYAKPADFVSKEAFQACVDILVYGNMYEPAGGSLYMYNPDICDSPWHEAQIYVGTCSGCRFFM